MIVFALDQLVETLHSCTSAPELKHRMKLLVATSTTEETCSAGIREYPFLAKYAATESYATANLLSSNYKGITNTMFLHMVFN